MPSEPWIPHLKSRGVAKIDQLILDQYGQGTCWRFAGSGQGFPCRGDFSIKRQSETEGICGRTAGDSNQGSQCDSRERICQFLEVS